MNTIVKDKKNAFLKGFSSAFDFTGKNLIDLHEMPSGFERDRMMLNNDWQRIGNDIRNSMSIFKNEKQ